MLYPMGDRNSELPQRQWPTTKIFKHINKYLYYKRGDPYLCSAKAPVLDGSGNRRLYPLKGTSVDRVFVCLLPVSIVGFFTIRQKRILGGRTYAECNSGPFKQHLVFA